MAAADREKVAEIVQATLTEASPETVGGYINRAEEYFLSKTNRAVIPDRATYLWADLAIEISKSGLPASGQQTVSSIKRGDTTIEYGGSSNGLSGIDARIVLFKVAKIR